MENERKRVKGTDCDRVHLDVYQWVGGKGVWWQYKLWGRRLYRNGELIEEAIRTLADAVLFSRGYDHALLLYTIKATWGKLQAASHGAAAAEEFFKWDVEGK